jgi:hypothetical protein
MSATSSEVSQVPENAVERTTNGFLIRRVEALRSLRRNPYEAHIAEFGQAKSIVVGRAATPVLNRIFGANFADLDQIRQLNAWFAQYHAIPPYQILTTPDRLSKPPSGFAKLPELEYSVLESDDVATTDPAPEIVVEEVSKDHAETFSHIYAEAIGYSSAIALPLCRSVELLMGSADVVSYIAKISGEPVCVGQLFLGPEGTAYLGSTGIIPRARHTGCDAALDQRRMTDAYRAGYRRLCRRVAINSQDWRNAAKMGFRTAYREEVYAPAAMLSGSGARPAEKPVTSSAGCCAVQLRA